MFYDNKVLWINRKTSYISFDLVNVHENSNCSDLEAITQAPSFPQSLFKLDKVLGNTTLFHLAYLSLKREDWELTSDLSLGWPLTDPVDILAE